MTGSFLRMPVVQPSLRIKLLALLVATLCLLTGATWADNSVDSILVDPLDGQPLGWRLSEADAAIDIRGHWLDATGGEDQRPCEAITVAAGNGTRVLLEYRIDPCAVLDEVRASIAVQAGKAGPQVGLRIRYPRIMDPSTRQPLAALVWGESHRGRGEWQRLRVSGANSKKRVREMAIRDRFGSQSDTNDSYIDAIVLNIYSGPGTATLRLDNLRAEGLLSITGQTPTRDADPADLLPGPHTMTGSSGLPASWDLLTPRNLQNRTTYSAVNSAFPAGKISRVIEHNGESLEYLKLLACDAVLLARPPTVEILREAVRHEIAVYAPLPSAVNPDLEPLLTAVAGWYLGTSTDDSQLEYVVSESQRLQAMPPLWHRPLLLAPAESWDRYAGIATTMIYDLPLSLRGLSGHEELDLLQDQRQRAGRPIVPGVGVATSPPDRLVAQLDAIAETLGASKIDDYGWRGMAPQVWRGLSLGARGIVYRSARSLTSGDPQDTRRATSITIANRWLEVLGPLLSQSNRQVRLRASREDYCVTQVETPAADLVIATAAAGDQLPTPENSLRIPILRSRTRYAWRLTNTTVEQLTIEGQQTDRVVNIENPDNIEFIVLSDDPAVGGRLSRPLRQQALLINQQRWQLVGESLLRTREDWEAAIGGGMVPRSAAPHELLRTAAELLAPVQNALSAQRYGEAMRAIRAADEMTLRCEVMLNRRLRLPGVVASGMPTLLAPGGVMLHLAWLPGLEDGTWSDNLLAAGELDQIDTMLAAGWRYQSRLERFAHATVAWQPRAGEAAANVLRIESVAHGKTPLPGGYAGTVARVRSAPITFAPGSWVRIRARVKTLGFGGPNQGLLIYDSDSGSELGTLVSNQPEWTTVELYRLITSDRPFRVTFEGIGAGEALVDWVRVQIWKPPATKPQFRPISQP
ncbi:hypothetical protein SH139x_004338 [Planctomycetaceae bacterium SH139]